MRNRHVLNLRIAASGSFLFETRLGCLQPHVPARTCQFIDAMQQMMDSSLYLIVGDRLHRALNTSYWRRHKHAWDQLFSIGNAFAFKCFMTFTGPTLGPVDQGRFSGSMLARDEIPTTFVRKFFRRTHAIRV